MIKNWLLVATACFVSQSAVSAETDLAIAFGARAAAQGMAISPNGSKALFLAPANARGTGVVVIDTATGATNVAIANTGNNILPVSCGWKTETRLICTLYGITKGPGGILSFTRVVAVTPTAVK